MKINCTGELSIICVICQKKTNLGCNDLDYQLTYTEEWEENKIDHYETSYDFICECGFELKDNPAMLDHSNGDFYISYVQPDGTPVSLRC